MHGRLHPRNRLSCSGSTRRTFLKIQVAAVMSKTEIALLLLLVAVLAFGLWFIFSDQVWIVSSWIETWLYPAIEAPE
jgi:membrane protein YdbS with pleckstrin-like domain